LSVVETNFVRFVDFCLRVGAVSRLPEDLTTPLGHSIQLFVDTLLTKNKPVSVLPIARSVAIGFFLIHLRAGDRPVPRDNAIVAKKVYKSVSSRANKTRITEKKVHFNVDLLAALGDVLEAVAKAVAEALPASTLLAKLRVLLFVWRLCERTGCRPATLIELQVYDRADWDARGAKEKQQVAIVRFPTPRGPTYMFTTSQRKHAMAAPVEYRSVWTYDRDTGRPGHLFEMHQAFVDAFAAHEFLHDGVDRRYDSADGTGLVDPNTLLFRTASAEFTRNGAPSKHPPYMAGNYRSNNLSPSDSARGQGPAYSTLFTKTVMSVFRGVAGANGLTHLFGRPLPRVLRATDLPLKPASRAMLAYFQRHPTVKVGIYDLRRANDTMHFAGVLVAEKVLERIGFDAVKYAQAQLRRHLKLTDHSEKVAETFYNQTGTTDQVIDLGQGFLHAFRTCRTVHALFDARDAMGSALDDRVRLSHRTQGLRTLRKWVDEGRIPSPFGLCERMQMVLLRLLGDTPRPSPPP
jgi:hypothetical protein